MQPFLELVAALHLEDVRFVLIGVAGANYYAPTGASRFFTQDRDLFLPRDPDNLVRAWRAADRSGFSLWCAREPLDSPRDLWLAEHIVAQRALTQAQREAAPPIDFTLVMGEFEFEAVWSARRTFVDENVGVPVALLSHIVESKAQAGRPKDDHFLNAHRAELASWFGPVPHLDRPECRGDNDTGPDRPSPPENSRPDP